MYTILSYEVPVQVPVFVKVDLKLDIIHVTFG